MFSNNEKNNNKLHAVGQVFQGMDKIVKWRIYGIRIKMQHKTKPK